MGDTLNRRINAVLDKWAEAWPDSFNWMWSQFGQEPLRLMALDFLDAADGAVNMEAALHKLIDLTLEGLPVSEDEYRDWASRIVFAALGRGEE